MKILLLDHDYQVSEAISAELKANKFEVSTTTSNNFFTDCATLNPDLIMIDHQPGSTYSGLKLCKLIKTKTETWHIPVVLISEVANIHELSEGCEADAYVLKPLDLEDLSNTVKDILSL